MLLRALCLLLSIWSSFAYGRESEPLWSAPWQGLPELVQLLRSIPEGELILKNAAARDPQFLQKIKRGNVSITESTFHRTYSLWDGKEQIELRHEITLDQKLALSDALVDLAHELVHFSEKEMLDPYKADFALKEFVQQGIEGPGGELKALAKECEVAWALQRKYRTYPNHRLCAPYRSKEGFRWQQARSDYYALGHWHKKISKALRALPVSDRPVLFTSSYAGKPYPIALAEEFASTRQAACANNRRKYKLIAAQAQNGRRPASQDLYRERQRLRAYDRLYCSEMR